MQTSPVWVEIIMIGEKNTFCQGNIPGRKLTWHTRKLITPTVAMNRDQQKAYTEQIMSDQFFSPLLDLEVTPSLFWQNLAILAVMMFSKAVCLSVCVCVCKRDLSFIFEGKGFAIHCRVLLGFWRLAENGERQTASVRSWHQTVRCWRMWGPKGGTSHRDAHSHTMYAYTRAHFMVTNTYI